jgi:hypothetical protein
MDRDVFERAELAVEIGCTEIEARSRRARLAAQLRSPEVARGVRVAIRRVVDTADGGSLKLAW